MELASVLVVAPRAQYLDLRNTAEFKSDMALLLAHHTRIVLDLYRVETVDSSAIGAFVSCLKRVLPRGGDLKLCCLAAEVRTIAELTKLHRIVEIWNTREEAIRAFGI
ncbi:MAG TPA: STAS domain-containing protein [Gemmataceae bacterium]|nr:STAS domain-containing protein [Gemmataceae bacterium]